MFLKMACNVLRLCAGGAFEKQQYQLTTKVHYMQSVEGTSSSHNSGNALLNAGAEIEEPYFDKNGKEIKEFAVLKVFHFKGVNEQGRGRKTYYMYKWVRLVEHKGKLWWTARHLTNADENSYYNLRAVANPQTRIISDCEIVQQYGE